MPSAFTDNSGEVLETLTADWVDINTLGTTNLLCDISSLEGTLPLEGKIALIETGSCSYEVKINNASTLGALAAIIYNNEAGGNARIVMEGDQVNIPAVFIARQDDLDLLAETNKRLILKTVQESPVVIDPYK